MTTMFTLPPIPPTSFFPLREVEASSSRHTIAKLPTIQPEYQLEDVDEYEWQGDKVLPAVERGLEWAKPLQKIPDEREAGGLRSRKGKGKERAEVRAVEEGIWAERADLAFPHVDREALSSSTGDPFEMLSSSISADSVFGLLASGADIQQPIQLPQLDAEPDSHITSAQLLPILFLRAGLLRTEVKHVKWDKAKARYRLSSRRLAQVGNEDLAARAEVPLRIASAVERLEMCCGELTGRLEEDCQTTVALRYATRTYLAHCRSTLIPDERSGPADNPDDFINLKGVEQALAAVCGIWSWPLDAQSARPAASMPSNTLLSHIYNELVANISKSDTVNNKQIALAYFMRTTSRPLFQLIAAWVGLLPEPSALPAFSLKRDQQLWIDIGITQHTTCFAGNIKHDYTFDTTALPAFISPAIGERIYEGGKSLRLLRDASPGHPAAEHWSVPFVWNWMSHGQSGSNGTEVHMRSIRRKMESWREGLDMRATTPLGGSRSGSAPSGRDKEAEEADEHGDPMPDGAMVLSHSDTAVLQSPNPPTPVLATHTSPSLLTSSSDLHLPCNASAWADFLQQSVFALPLAHADSVNKALVTLIFDELHYASHLDVLNAYWLGGDATFSERVAAALLGVGRDDVDSSREAGMGRRARTRARMGLPAHYASVNPAPTGEGGPGAHEDARGQVQVSELESHQRPPAVWGIALGVGLSDRQRWPPGGSEMAYALRTTLVDAEVSGMASCSRSERARAEVWDKVQDTVSFAIRPLPQDEEAKRAWMDPQSIEALDFLFLAYSPPLSLSIVLPRRIIDRYQAIHNHLLRFSRAQVVLRGMYRDITRRPGDNPALSPEMLSIATELRVWMSHFVETSARYVIDIAIGANIREMQRRLEGMRPRTARQPSTADAEDGSDKPVRDDSQHGNDLSPNDEIEAEPTDPSIDTASRAVSVQSLLDDHSTTLDMIMRCCLLAEDEHSEMAYDALMRLLSLVLDAGKAICSVVNGWADDSATLSALSRLRREWKEAETWFTRVVSRVARDARDTITSDSSSGQRQRGKKVELALREWLLRLDLYMGTTRPSQANEE